MDTSKKIRIGAAALAGAALVGGVTACSSHRTAAVAPVAVSACVDQFGMRVDDWHCYGRSATFHPVFFNAGYAVPVIGVRVVGGSTAVPKGYSAPTTGVKPVSANDTPAPTAAPTTTPAKSTSAAPTTTPSKAPTSSAAPKTTVNLQKTTASAPKQAPAPTKAPAKPPTKPAPKP